MADRSPSGSTRVAAVIGSPVEHSLSPAIHNAAFAATGLDWAYVAFEVGPGRAAAAIAAMRTLGLAGLSVTMPHKHDVIDALDGLAPAGERLSAVNCIAWDGDRLIGHNTDGSGFVAALDDELGIEPAGRTFGVLGAGGAARSVIDALGDAGAERIVVVNRSDGRAAEAASLAAVAEVGTSDDLGDLDVVVNATPVGMDGTSTPVTSDRLGDAAVVDLVYAPAETPLLAAARERGCPAANGVGMLVHQAARAFELWTGLEAPLEAMKRAVVRKG